MSDDPVWRLAAVSLAGRQRPRLDNLSVTIPRGITAVLGESGAGKTSLLNLLVGFESPTSGAIDRIPSADDRLPVFWSPPDHGLWPHLTVREHLQASGGTSVPPVRESLLTDFDLTAVADAYPATLSQGERVRLTVVRALTSGAATLVLDEPFANLDGPHREQCAEALQRHMQPVGPGTVCLDSRLSLRERECFRGAKADYGNYDVPVSGPSAIVFSTHQPDLVLRLADHVICLHDGSVLATGSPRELYASPPNRQVADLLGPGNWFEEGDAVRWLPGNVSGCIRPERLRLETASNSDLEVVDVRPLGCLEQVTLQHGPSSMTKAIIHPASSHSWKRGDRVLLRMLSLLLITLLGGCGSEGDLLPTKSVTAWTLPAEGRQLPAPRAVTAAPDGTIYALDNVGRVLAFNPLTESTKTWWMPEFTVGRPERILVRRDGRMVIADTHYNRVVCFDRDGQLCGMFGTKGEGPGEFIYPVAIAEDDRQNLYVCEYGGHDRVQIFRPDGEYVGEFGSFGVGPGQFQRPSGIIWHDGRLYIADAFNNRIFVCDEQGQPAALPPTAFAADLHYPYDIARSPTGEFYVVEYGAGRVTRFAADGALAGRYVGEGTSIGPISTPWGLGVDPQGRVLVADTGNRRLVRVEFEE